MRCSLVFLSLVVIASLPAFGQEKLYPIRGNTNFPSVLTSDRSAFVVEKAFQHRLTLGFASDDQTSLLPDTKAPLVMLWLKISNASQRPLAVDISKFTATDEEGRTISAMSPDEASNRMIEGATGGSIGTKTLRGISLGRVGSKGTEEEVKEDILRYSIQTGQIPVGGVREGLIYFEAPRRKKFTINVRLGDLWSQPLAFSTEKTK